MTPYSFPELSKILFTTQDCLNLKENVHDLKYIIVFSLTSCRDLGTQTLQDHYTNVPKPNVYLAGLRGGKGILLPTELTKFDLTLDVEHC